MIEDSDDEIIKIMKDVVSIELENTTIRVPRIIDNLFKYINNHIVEGIFRVSGSARRMKEYSNTLSDYESWLNEANVNDICGLVKKMIYSSLKDSFTVKLCEEIKVLYMEYIREVEMEEDRLLSANEYSDESFSTAHTTAPTAHLDRISRKLTQLLIEKSPECKNHLFLYVIYKLNYLQAYVDITKMTTTNLAIVFQPLIFTGDLHELILFQKLLYMLISKSDKIISAYGKYSTDDNIPKYTEVEQYPFLASRMASVDELQNYDENTSNFSRRKSLSNRLSVLLNSYYIPASKSRYSLRPAIQSKESLISGEEEEEEAEEEEIQNSVAPLLTELCKSKDDLCSSIGSSENIDILNIKLDIPPMKNSTGMKSNSSYFSNNKSRDSLFQIMDSINKESSTRSTDNLQDPIPDNVSGTLNKLVVEESNIKSQRRKSILQIFKNPKASLSNNELSKTLTKSSSDDMRVEKKTPALERNKSIFKRSFTLKIKSRK